MSRYIDADALITDLNKGLWGKDWDKVLAEAIINEAPSIDIVRCKECKYYNVYLDEHGSWKRCDLSMVGAEADCFCSWGERSSE